MQEKQYYVYTHARPGTNDIHGVFYVGKGNEQRVKHVRRFRNPHHTNIVRKYGAENIIIRKILCKDEQAALRLEVEIIHKLRELGVQLANITNGGEGVSGFKPSKESRLKMSESAKAYIRNNPEKRKELSDRAKTIFSTPEGRERQRLRTKHHFTRPGAKERASEYGSRAWATPEMREKTITGLKNRLPPSEESKRKKSASLKRYWENQPEEKRQQFAERMKALGSKPLSEETKLKIAETRRKNGYQHSDEWKALMSEKMTGRRHTEESKKKMSEIQKNRPPITDETRKKLVESHMGHVQTDETKQKRSQSMRANWEARKALISPEDRLRAVEAQRERKNLRQRELRAALKSQKLLNP